jgi:hypothetical protein
MKVYVVLDGPDYERSLVGVFYTVEAAMAALPAKWTRVDDEWGTYWHGPGDAGRIHEAEVEGPKPLRRLHRKAMQGE